MTQTNPSPYPILISFLINHFILSTGTPLQFLSREKNPSSCRSIGDSIKKHIFHKSLLNKTPKRGTPSGTSSNTPLIQVSIDSF